MTGARARANLGDGCWDGLGKPKERQSKVDESILIALNLAVSIGELELECRVSTHTMGRAIPYLVQLQTHQPNHQRCGSGNGRNDLPSYAFTLHILHIQFCTAALNTVHTLGSSWFVLLIPFTHFALSTVHT